MLHAIGQKLLIEEAQLKLTLWSNKILTYQTIKQISITLEHNIWTAIICQDLLNKFLLLRCLNMNLSKVQHTTIEGRKPTFLTIVLLHKWVIRIIHRWLGFKLVICILVEQYHQKAWQEKDRRPLKYKQKLALMVLSGKNSYQMQLSKIMIELIRD